VFVSLKVIPQLLADDSGYILRLSVRMDGYTGEKDIPLTEAGEHTILLTKTEERDRSSPKRRKRASMKQEEQVAVLHGGHRNAGSGSVAGRASDASIRERFRIENKYTAGAGIRVTKADVNKIRGECERGQIPVFQMDFKEPNTLRNLDRWVMVPLEEWTKYIAEAD